MNGRGEWMKEKVQRGMKRCKLGIKYEHFFSLRKSFNNLLIALFSLASHLCAESNARVIEAVRLDLQQQMVHGHLDNPVPEQEGSVRGEDSQEPAHHLLPRVHR